MGTAEIYSRLTDILRDVFGADDLTATPELAPSDVEDWDSLGHLRLILAIQTAFDVKFSAAEIGGLKNMGDLAQLIQAKTA